ncbi:MAG: hypothetical protein A3K19_33720 [Lentisphaerae bacterium RIFOXYB12_FULL_65_16]|nr:MAG: hypothetical protein A3K19_30325 [Lentisphaerae bacterium RIFOXYB12_FULL_65_16]OGV95393.1 MAG: hypothetical protein A3K19_33720 [Lentisphaerae bacterium RIFOXYB12_FULL_65_16]
MPDWNPYESALSKLKDMSPEAVQEYLFTRLAGGVSEPMHNWSRNQEAPEDFLVWAHRGGDGTLKTNIEAATATLLKAVLERFGGVCPHESQVLSRLLYLAAAIRCAGAGMVLQEKLVTREGGLALSLATRLLKEAEIPWGETLLHQTLATLSVLEKGMEDRRRRARSAFWHPIARLDEPRYDTLPSSLQIVALRALARLNWLYLTENWDSGRTYIACYVTKSLHEDIKRTQPMDAVARELADALNFFIQESILQERQEPGRRRKPDLLQDQTPIARAFWFVAGNPEVSGLLRMALAVIGRSSAVFGGDRGLQDSWLSREWRVMKELFAVDPSIQRDEAVDKASDQPGLLGRLGGLRTAQKPSWKPNYYPCVSEALATPLGVLTV